MAREYKFLFGGKDKRSPWWDSYRPLRDPCLIIHRHGSAKSSCSSAARSFKPKGIRVRLRCESRTRRMSRPRWPAASRPKDNSTSASVKYCWLCAALHPSEEHSKKADSPLTMIGPDRLIVLSNRRRRTRTRACNNC